MTHNNIYTVSGTAPTALTSHHHHHTYVYSIILYNFQLLFKWYHTLCLRWQLSCYSFNIFLCILINVAVWLSVVQIYHDLFLHFANWSPSRWVPTFHFYQLCWMDTHVHVGDSLYLKEELLGLRESIFSSLVVLNFSLKKLLPFILSSAAHRGPAALLSWEHLVLLFCFCFCFVFHFCQLMERLWGSPTNKTTLSCPSSWPTEK